MELTEQLGQEIIQRLSPYIEFPVNLMNADGKVVASSDPSRVGQLHGGAKQVIHHLQSQMITDQEVEQFDNTKPGVNLPIFHRGQLAGVVGLTGSPDDVTQAAGMTRGAVEIALEQIHLQRQAFNEERQWNHWLHQLLRPGEIDVKELEREATYTLEIDIRHTWQVIVFQSSNHFKFAEQINKLCEHERPLFVLPYQESTVVATVTGIDPKRLEAMFKARLDGVKAGVGGPAFGLTGIRRSYFQAQEAIGLAGQEGQFVYSCDLPMERLLLHIDSQSYHQVGEVYRSQLQQMECPYIETLKCYFASDLKMNRTAEKMHIHRNTLIYRLDQVSKKVGLDPRVFKDAVILQTILIKDF